MKIICQDKSHAKYNLSFKKSYSIFVNLSEKERKKISLQSRPVVFVFLKCKRNRTHCWPTKDDNIRLQVRGEGIQGRGSLTFVSSVIINDNQRKAYDLPDRL
jgi:hypothetical protein